MKTNLFVLDFMSGMAFVYSLEESESDLKLVDEVEAFLKEKGHEIKDIIWLSTSAELQDERSKD